MPRHHSNIRAPLPGSPWLQPWDLRSTGSWSAYATVLFFGSEAPPSSARHERDKRMKRIGLLTAAALFASAASVAAQPIPIRLGYGPAAEEQLWLMKAKPDITPGQKKDYTLDYQLFRGTDQRFKAVEAGELDVFTGSAASTILAWSQGFDFRAVASVTRESDKSFVVQYMVQ